MNMKKILPAIFIVTTIVSAPLAMAASSSSQLTPGENAAFNSDKNDQGHWRINSTTGEKTWVSGEEDQAMINQALCSNIVLRQINHCS